MRTTGFLLVIGTYVAVALVTLAIIRVGGWESHDIALVAATIVAAQVGTYVWHRQCPTASAGSVKVPLGATLSMTGALFILAFLAVTDLLPHPEVTLFFATLGGFLFPFVLVGPMWKALNVKTDAKSDGS